MKGQHLTHGAGFREGIEQIFGVIAVIQPAVGRRLVDHRVDGMDMRPRPAGVEHQVQDHALGVKRHLRRAQRFGRQGENALEPRLQVVGQRRGDLDLVLDQDHRDRPAGQLVGRRVQETLQRDRGRRPGRGRGGDGGRRRRLGLDQPFGIGGVGPDRGRGLGHSSTARTCSRALPSIAGLLAAALTMADSDCCCAGSRLLSRISASTAAASRPR